MNRRGFIKCGLAGVAVRAVPNSVAFIAARSTAIRLGVIARRFPIGSRLWYAAVDEAMKLSASFPKTKGALFELFVREL